MRRTIKSFVLRAGRVSKRQQFALDHWLKNYELSMGTLWDLNALFCREAVTIVEIGFGMGGSLLTMAEQNPDTNFIGIEVHRAGIGSLAAELHDHNLSNVRIVSHDAVAVFEKQLSSNTLDGVQIFFPDPWHKKRHHKRRLIQPNFVKLIIDRLKPNGFIHCVTDWQEYANHMHRVLSAATNLVNSQSTGGFCPRSASRPLTKFEHRGNRLGHGVWELYYLKTTTPP